MQIRVVENKQIKHMAIVFYQKDATVYAVHYKESENPLDVSKLEWLFSGAKKVQSNSLENFFVGPRREMITPWSTNAVEITQNMGISGILRIEEFTRVEDEKAAFDPMLQAFTSTLFPLELRASCISRISGHITNRRDWR